ncbi:hypothetical protein [Lactobacillus kalixensis]|nr:hypothetical protein [Lactobacillus kalixensis]
MSVNETTRLHIVKGNNVDHPSKIGDNSNGGEPPMDKDKYVTHTELELSNEKLLRHIDNRFAEMDKRFAELNNNINDVKNIANFANKKVDWVLGILASIVAGIVVAAITKLFS